LKKSKYSRNKFPKALLYITYANILAIGILTQKYNVLVSAKNELQTNITEVVEVSNINTEDIYLSPLGITVGIKVNTDGIMVLGNSDDSTPGEDGLQPGDHIVFANKQRLESKEDLQKLVRESKESIDLVIKRNNQVLNLDIVPKLSEEGQRKLGVWVRDMAQGVGTVTYYNPKSGKFGALGHGIIDSNTKDLMDISGGEISLTHVESIKKGKKRYTWRISWIYGLQQHFWKY